jgi:hypothetical protein
VSFFINIGINMSALHSKIDCSIGIVLAAVVSLVLSGLNMKFAAYSSALGVAMTSLTLLSLVLSAKALNDSVGGGDSSAGAIAADPRQYKVWHPQGLPLSLGLISFCFGGHGALLVLA